MSSGAYGDYFTKAGDWVGTAAGASDDQRIVSGCSISCPAKRYARVINHAAIGRTGRLESAAATRDGVHGFGVVGLVIQRVGDLNLKCVRASVAGRVSRGVG